VADGYQGFDPHAWERSFQTTMQDLRRDVEEAATRNYQMLALLDAAGRVTLNHGGEGMTWPVRYKNHRAEGATGENARNFVQTNLWKTAALEYRGYEVTDSIKRREVEKNKGAAAIIKVMDGFTDRLRESLMHELGPQFYMKGHLTANDRFWHGLGTLEQMTGQTINKSTGAFRSKNQEDKIAVPGGTYAQLNMALGSYGGEQHGTNIAWPLGTADVQYDFWSPLLVIHDSTSWSGSSTGQKLSDAFRFGIVNAQRNADQMGQITNATIDRNLFIELANYHQTKETIEVTAGVTLKSLGFRNVIVFDGVEVSWEAATPSNYGYGWNINNIELMGMTSNLYEVEGPEYDLRTQAFNAVVSTLSNFKFRSPRNFAIWLPYADVANTAA
jgi:hypothetical protein